jgi:hypothetical protein
MKYTKKGSTNEKKKWYDWVFYPLILVFISYDKMMWLMDVCGLLNKQWGDEMEIRCLCCGKNITEKTANTNKGCCDKQCLKIKRMS